MFKTTRLFLITKNISLLPLSRERNNRKKINAKFVSFQYLYKKKKHSHFTFSLSFV